jgi:hypothetical protein
MKFERKRVGIRRWWPFVLLCAIAAVRWAVPESLPGAGSTPLSLVLGCGSACLVMLTVASRERMAAPRSGTFAASFAAGALMLCGPAAAMLLRVPGLEVGALTIALALVPVVIAVARTAFRQTEGAEFAGRTWPGLAAVAGLLLLLPQPSLSGWREDVALALAPLATGIGAAWLRTRNAWETWRAVAALAGAAVVFGVCTLAARPVWAEVAVKPLLLSAALDGLMAALSVMALFRVGMTRWSAQFELVPLLVLLEGLGTAQPRVDVRVLIGLGLIVVASIFLLLPPPAGEAAQEPGDAV